MGVWASLDDMVRWDAGWRQGKVLKAATQKAALVPSTYGDGETCLSAFGWFLTMDDGKLLGMSHNGNSGGFHAFVVRYLPQDRTLIVLGNVDTLNVDAIARLFQAMPPKGK